VWCQPLRLPAPAARHYAAVPAWPLVPVRRVQAPVPVLVWQGHARPDAVQGQELGLVLVQVQVRAPVRVQETQRPTAA